MFEVASAPCGQAPYERHEPGIRISNLGDREAKHLAGACIAGGKLRPEHHDYSQPARISSPSPARDPAKGGLFPLHVPKAEI
jgi:hypothetical protein